MTNSLENKHRTYLNRHIARARNRSLDYKELTSQVNAKFGTRFSVNQISAYLGNKIR